ncbi:MAG: hypothetical protein AAB650_01260, partial [Patescibacteria group bacterium]
LRRAAAERLGVLVRVGPGAILPMFGAAVLAGLAAYLALQPFPALVATNTFAGILLQGFVAGVAGFAVYGVVLAWQENPEILGIIESIRERLISPAKTPEVFETEKLNGEGTK